jgi:hypothetical protein
MIKDAALIPATSTNRLASYLGVAVVLALVIVALVPAMPSLYHMPGTDNAIFLLMGDKIRQGNLPFRDWYDHKPPLIFYLNALGLWLGQGSRWGVWAVELVSLVAAALCGYAFLKRYFGVLAAALGVSATLLSLSLVFERGNLTEEYALPYTFAAFLLLAQEEERPRPGWRMAAVGMMIAMASTLKQPLAGFGLAVTAYLLLRYLVNGQPCLFVLAMARIFLGFAAVWLAWFAYFLFLGIFPEFWDAAFALNFALSSQPLADRLSALRSAIVMLWNLSGYFLAGMLAWLAAVVLLLRDSRSYLTLAGRPTRGQPVGNDPQTAPLLLPLVIGAVGFPVDLVLSGLSGSNFVHYFTALLPTLTVLIAFLAHALVELFRPASKHMPSPIWLAALFIPVLAPGAYSTIDQMGPRGDRQIEAMIEYVNANTQPGDTIYQWGINPQVYIFTGRDSPSRYFFPNHLFIDGYSGQEQTAEFLHSLQAHPPAVIFDGSIERIPLLIPVAPESCEVVKDPAYYAQYVAKWEGIDSDKMPQMPQGMDEVYFWICENYAPAGTVGELGWRVYRWKGN